MESSNNIANKSPALSSVCVSVRMCECRRQAANAYPAIDTNAKCVIKSATHVIDLRPEVDDKNQQGEVESGILHGLKGTTNSQEHGRFCLETGGWTGKEVLRWATG